MQKYTVDRVVGEGSFGKALLCKRKVDNRKCIIKQISLGKMSRSEAKATEQESALLARLQHPNIVSFWESFNETTRGRANLYIVMDFADGGDLSDLIKNRRNRLMSEKQVVNIAVQISLAMKHVHDRKILHRDLKSGNIFLTKSGVVKLGDFGIARVLRNTGELASTQIGTPYFMSPEILQNKRYNSKTDIWSLGCVFFELAALKVPFNGSSMKQLVANIVRQSTPRISSQYSKEFASLLYAMLAKNSKERPSINTVLSQAVMRNEIANILEDGVRQKEFSHTILHGDHILKKAPLVNAPLGAIKEESPKPSKSVASSVNHVNQALMEARARANAQAQVQQREKALQAQKDAAARLREHEARRKVEEMKLQAAKQLRRKQIAEQAARDEAIRKRREKENAEKMAAQRKQEHARRQEKNAQYAKQQEAERLRLAQYRKACEAREKERAVAARAKLLEDRKQYELNKKAAEDAANKVEVDLYPPPPPPQACKNVIKPQQNGNQAVAVARGGMGFNIKGGAERRLNPRMKPSIPRQHIAPKNELRIDGHGQERPKIQAQARPQEQAGRGGGGRILVVKEGYGAPSAAQLRRERFERLKEKAKASQEVTEAKKENKRAEASDNMKKKVVQQVGQLTPALPDTDSDSDTEECTYKPARNKKPLIVAENKWFSNLEQQMGDLKGDLNLLREGRSPKANTPPQPPSKAPAVQKPALKESSPKPPTRAPPYKAPNKGAKKPVPAKTVVTPPSAQELAMRKVRREEESKNLREFVRAQRNQMGTPSPPAPPGTSPRNIKSSKAPENLSIHFSDNVSSQKSPKTGTKSPKSSARSPKSSKNPQSSGKSVKSTSSTPSPNPNSPVSKNLSAAEAMRKKRDAERREMKKMIAEKRNEKIQIMHQELEVATTEEVLVVNDKTPSPPDQEKSVASSSPTRVKFQDFLGRDYTPVTSEEDAATLQSREEVPQMQQPKPSADNIMVKGILTSTDDFELNKRTESEVLKKQSNDEGKVLVSSSCGDLLLSMKKFPQDKPRVEEAATTVIETQVQDEVEMEATNHVYEQPDPSVLDQLAEEMGEVWGDNASNIVEVVKVDDNLSVDPSEVMANENSEEDISEHAAADFNNMLSAMQEALDLPDRVHNEGDEDDDSTFEEEEDDVEANRIVGTFSPAGDDELEAVVDGIKSKDDKEIDNESDSESLGSSWGEVEEDGEGLDNDGDIANYEMINNIEEPPQFYEDNFDDDIVDDIPPPSYVSEHDMTVYGVPFPIATDQRELEGLSLHDEDSAACRMEYIREFLEGALGEEQFIQAYRLLKSIDIIDEDMLLEQMERIVGTDGLKHMEVFIQLITIEERFETL